jgi:CheY-like chemotaxis protein
MNMCGSIEHSRHRPDSELEFLSFEAVLGLKSYCSRGSIDLCSTGTERWAKVTIDPRVKIRIGVVDDDVSVRRALSRLLRIHGYSCLSYDSAEAALKDPEFLQMNCIIVDVRLGGMNGFELGHRLDVLHPQIPRIFITAHMSTDLPDHPGDSVLLTKPFDENQLLALIEQATS